MIFLFAIIGIAKLIRNKEDKNEYMTRRIVGKRTLTTLFMVTVTKDVGEFTLPIQN